MKKCPTCSNTYEDNLKFCQADGTPLVADKPEDPYKTMVAKQSDLQIPPEISKEELKPPEPVAPTPAPDPKPEPPPPAPAVPEQKVAPEPTAAPEAKPPAPPEPKPEPPAEAELDPMRTMMISGNTRDNVRVDIPEESPKTEDPKTEDPKKVGSKKDEQKAGVPKIASSAPAPELEIGSAPKVKEAGKPTPPAPELPKFDSPEVAPPVLESTNLDAKLKDKIESDSLPTPPSKPPTAELPKADKPSKPGGDAPSTPKMEVKDKPSVPIPSPFDKSMPPGYAPPSTPPFDPTEPVRAEKVGSAKSPVLNDDFANPSAPIEKQNKNQFGSNAISGDVKGSAAGENKSLAIISLVCGVLSMTLCCGSIGLLLGPIGAVTGFMARSKANQEPDVYGGSGLALGGLITGIVGFIVSIAALVAYFVLNLGAMANF